jgi:Fur family transcriptional regulator, ferric uptake regulator
MQNNIDYRCCQSACVPYILVFFYIKIIANDLRLWYDQGMRTISKQGFESILHDNGFKATPGRVAILKTLKRIGRPISISRIHEEIGQGTDQATVYRAVEALVGSGIIRRVDLQNVHGDYELAESGDHHHHLVCEKCGRIEKVIDCEPGDIEKSVLKGSRNFKEIRSHSLEFFGLCNGCI